MSLVSIELIEGVFTSEEKAGIIRDLTAAIAPFEGEGGAKNTIVTIKEIKSGDWGANGQPLAAQDVRSPG
jgi:4-oxalocrotonate tautomerase